MFDFLLVYPVAALIGLLIGLGAPAATHERFFKRTAYGALAGVVLAAVMSLFYFSVVFEAPIQFALFLVLGAFWAGLFGGAGGLLGSCVRRLIGAIRKR